MELYEHQKEIVKQILEKKQINVIADPGTGKTLPTLVSILFLLKRGDIKKVLIVAPLSALGAWSRDMEKFFNEDDANLLHRSIQLINYDKLTIKKYKPIVVDEYDFVVLDEIHYIKNKRSKRTNVCEVIASVQEQRHKVGICNNYRVGLTGTPISNCTEYNSGGLANLWNLMTFLHPAKAKNGTTVSAVFGSYNDFINQYFTLNQWWQPERCLDKETILTEFNKDMIRVKKEDCLDLPDKQHIEILVDMTPKQKKYSKSIIKKSCLDTDGMLKVYGSGLERMTAARTCCSGFLNINDETFEVPNNKIKYLEDLINTLPEDEKIVIFTSYKKSMSDIQALMEKMKIKYLSLDGSTKDKQNWKQFQSDDSIRVFIGNYQSAGTGIDLFKSHICLYYEPQLSSVIYSQSQDRIHRSGQDKKCLYYHLILKDSIEESIQKNIESMEDFGETAFEKYCKNFK